MSGKEFNQYLFDFSLFFLIAPKTHRWIKQVLEIPKIVGVEEDLMLRESEQEIREKMDLVMVSDEKFIEAIVR